MTKKFPLLAAALAVAFTVNAFAATPSCAANSAPTSAPRPIPSSVIKPTGLPMAFVDAVVKVEFALDEAGQPRDIKVLSVTNAVLKERLVAAFSQWRFESGVNGPAAGSQRFILPIRLLREV